MKTLENEFKITVAAGQTAIRVNTDEVPDAIAVMAEVCKKFGWDLQIFDKILGLQSVEEAASPSKAGQAQPTTQNAMAALQSLFRQPEKKTGTGKSVPVILVVKNLHFAIASSPESMIALIQLFAEEAKSKSQFLLAIMPHEAKLPPELEPIFQVIDHELPKEEELTQILVGISSTSGKDIGMTTEEKRAAARAALGLTRRQAEGVFARSRLARKKIEASYVWEEKIEQINKDGLVELFKGGETFDQVGGLDGCKRWLTRLLDPKKTDGRAIARAKGVALVGLPGTGKSLIAKCLGAACSRPVLLANPGNLMGSLVGETEKNTRRFFAVVKAMAPCIVVLDEVGKNMPRSGEGHDGGVGSRLLGTFLTQLNDLTEEVFFAYTENELESMHPAFFRAERNDLMFLVRPPGDVQRTAIWSLYLKLFFPAELKAGEPNPLHIPTTEEAMVSLYKAQKKVDVGAWTSKFAALALTIVRDEREAFYDRLEKLNEGLRDAVMERVVDDSGWTGAEIRHCCRLACAANMPVNEAASSVRPVIKTAVKSLEALETWAESNGCLDAETGELFSRADVARVAALAAGAKKVRRTVRNVADEN